MCFFFLKTLNIQCLKKKTHTIETHMMNSLVFGVSLSYECFTSAWVLSLLIWKKCKRRLCLANLPSAFITGTMIIRCQQCWGWGRETKSTKPISASSLLQFRNIVNIQGDYRNFQNHLLLMKNWKIYSLNILKQSRSNPPVIEVGCFLKLKCFLGGEYESLVAECINSSFSG